MSPLSIFFVFIFLLIGLMAPRNPDYNFPLSLELLAIGSLHLSLAFRTKQPTDYKALFSSREKQLFYAVLFLLVCVVTPRALYSVGVFGPVPNFCKATGINFQVIECLLQTAVNGPFGLRTLFQNYCALYILILTINIFRPTNQKNSNLTESSSLSGLKILAIWGALFTAASLALQTIGENNFIPEWLSHTSFRGRGSTIIANPGWVWPYLSVCLVSAYALSRQSRRKESYLYIAISLVCLTGMLATQQRGVLLLLAMLATAFFLHPLARNITESEKQSKKALKKSILGITIVMTVAASLVLFPSMLRDFLSIFGYKYKLTNLDSARFAMWEGAFDIISTSPIFGHGYASWFREIANYNSQVNKVEVYDTAHNFYIQLAAELGIPFAILHASLIVRTVKETLNNTDMIWRIFTVGFITAALCISIIQEIDYIRPTYYIFAFALGLVFASKTTHLDHRENYISSKTNTKNLVANRNWNLTAGALYVCLGLYIITLFNINVYPYEYSKETETKTKMSRWLGVESKISAGHPYSNDHKYTYYPIVESYREVNHEQAIVGGSLPGFPLSGINSPAAIIGGVGNLFTPIQNYYRFNTGGVDGLRVITKKIGYPATYSSTFLLPLKGFEKLDLKVKNVGIRCFDTCEVLASSCGIPGRAILKVSAINASTESDIQIRTQVGTLSATNSIPEILASLIYKDPGKRIFLSSEKQSLQIDEYGEVYEHGLIALRFTIVKTTDTSSSESGGILVSGGKCEP